MLLEKEGLKSKLLTGVMYKCTKCNEEIYFDDKYISKRGVNIPMDPDTGKYHVCKKSVHKRKGMLRVLTKTQIEYYKTLGLYPGATAKEIEEKFKEFVKMYHPDAPMPTKGGTCTCAMCDKKMRTVLYKQIIEAHNNIRLIRVVDE